MNSLLLLLLVLTTIDVVFSTRDLSQFSEEFELTNDLDVTYLIKDGRIQKPDVLTFLSWGYEIISEEPKLCVNITKNGWLSLTNSETIFQSDRSLNFTVCGAENDLSYLEVGLESWREKVVGQSQRVVQETEIAECVEKEIELSDFVGNFDSGFDTVKLGFCADGMCKKTTTDFITMCLENVSIE
eukprot:TRINITY_DN41338_c0_g1_i3.p1 TRINITY_DN41338_c0_g1~~TRINITY_DN41338_c0_g1_i3.p1  ORF type:complete len:185 (-),score=32.97 TRINITY_DN41338_c0_g1_i3:244-798(-)